MKISFFPSSVLLVLIFLMLFRPHICSLTADKSALLALKAYISPETQNILATNWTTATSVCNWVGVTCGGQPRRVVALNLPSMALDGTLPPQIGTVPSALGNMTSLKMINLSNNRLSGSITSSIFNVSSLQIINLSFNRLRGMLPMDMVNCLPDLKELYLSGNQLYGQIPSTLFNCRQLQVLFLSSNDFTGTIPAKLENFTMIRGLYFSDNSLEGKIPSSISNASELTVLDLAANSFTGPVPNTIGKLKNLQKLNLADNSLTSESSSTPESSFISSLTNNRHLRKIVLSGNPLEATLPMSIGNLSSSLEYFLLSDCKLKGNIPTEVGNLSSLIALRLANNALTGVIPNTVSRLQMLQSLHLQGNNLQGTILYELCTLNSLFELFLAGNELSGSVPDCLSNLTALRNLSLSSNRLTSAIPSSLWSLKDLLAINMSSNSLQGSLPLEIGNLKVAIEIDLSKNQLSGYIPNTIRELQSLVYLSFAVNRLQGPIPESFGGSLSLEVLDLSCNNLSGVIPKSLVGLRYLVYFNVSFNELEGEIPSEGVFSNFTAQSYVMNKALCGEARLQVPKCRTTGSSKRPPKKPWRTVLLLTEIMLPFILSMSILLLIYRATMHRQEANDPPLTTNRTILYQEIVLATDGFSENNIIGTGSFASVYKGTTKEEKNVAIKVFNIHLERGVRSFEVELDILSGTHHPNLVKLVCSCCDHDFRALVLEYMSNGTLDKWLHTHNYFLNLLQRLDIMIEVASALSYLHSIHVIHCDLKPSNILLNEDMVARVSDFSIAKDLGEDAAVQTRTMATVGYMAPEYGSSGIISEKTDVYSFGILLMETFTGKKPTDDLFEGEMNLRRWIYESLPHAVDRIIDVTLLQSDQEEIAATTRCIISILEVARYCTVASRIKRKTMEDVMYDLLRIKTLFGGGTELVEWEETLRELYPRISYNALKLATEGFSKRNLLDLGGFCSIYKGILKDKSIVAIKVFNPHKRRLESFEVQSQVLSFICHPNVVKILKYCSEDDFYALVLEYFPNWSLQKWLYQLHPGMYVLNFLQRLDIMINVASAFSYLHSMGVIHCNLNPGNVLLDDNMVAHVSGFSIAKLLDKGIPETKTTAMATAGYMAPEYELSGIVSEKTDVYSFGILLAETFTIIKPMEEMNWRSWICHSLQEIDTILDLNFMQAGEEYLETAAKRCLPSILRLAFCCTAKLSDERKTMRQVATELVRIKDYCLYGN